MNRRTFLGALLGGLVAARSAKAQLIINELSGFGAGGASGPVDISHTDNAISGTDGSSFSFAGRAFGAADSDRWIVVGVCTQTAGTDPPNVTDMTIGGVSATQVAEVNVGPNAQGGIHGSLWQANVPSGTTGDIDITLDVSAARATIGVFRRVGGANSTAHDTASAGHNDTTDPSITLNIPANGGTIGIAYTQENVAGFTWTGLTERYDEAVETSRHAGASDNFTAAVTGRTISVSHTATINNFILAASWG